MLNDAAGFKKVYLATGFTDLRRGIDGLAAIIRFQFKLDPYDRNTLFLFCGRRTDRIKGLLWEGDGFLLIYKRIENGALNWPRSSDEAMEITEEQYRLLMQGLEVVAKRPIREVENPQQSMLLCNSEYLKSRSSKSVSRRKVERPSC
ncbi:MAG: IS66 family insertion sequence element accessory protein TnpB [Eubacteriales bacterium]|nr:IS66 family insertion sequence element accessory protein TnpB [Eubacteriales bacterium]